MGYDNVEISSRENIYFHQAQVNLSQNSRFAHMNIRRTWDYQSQKTYQHLLEGLIQSDSSSFITQKHVQVE